MTGQELNRDKLPSAARERMERWLTSDGLRRHLEKALDTGRRPARTGPYIAISREAGSGDAGDPDEEPGVCDDTGEHSRPIRQDAADKGTHREAD